MDFCEDLLQAQTCLFHFHDAALKQIAIRLPLLAVPYFNALITLSLIHI